MATLSFLALSGLMVYAGYRLQRLVNRRQVWARRLKGLAQG